MASRLELAILGFLAGSPLPGHELHRRISHLTGYGRPVSDSLYPAINRLAKAGLLERLQAARELTAAAAVGALPSTSADAAEY
ncbi:PadR family transcriptional regulator [Streptomyces phaeochromogenes]